MKILKRILLALAILIVAPTIIFNQNIPAFIYNELEWQARARYLWAEEVQAQTDYLIGIRTGETEGVFIPDEEKIRLWEDIEKGLEVKKELIDEYFVFVNRQEKTPFLPAKYRKYHELKKPGFENYQKSFLIFKEVKEKEHKGFRLIWQLSMAGSKFLDFEKDISQEEYLTGLQDASEVANELIAQAKKLYQEGVIDEGFKQYVEINGKAIIDMAEILTDPKSATYSEEIAREIEAIGERKGSVDTDEMVTGWHKNIIDELNDEVQKYKDLTIEQMEEADRYYRENDLKNDLISRVLSKFSKSYPRNI